MRIACWLQVLPLLGDQKLLRERREAIGTVVPLAADARERREAIERELDATTREAKRLARESELEETRLLAIPTPGSIADVDEGRMEHVESRLAVVREQAEDLPRLDAERERVNGERVAVRLAEVLDLDHGGNRRVIGRPRQNG